MKSKNKISVLIVTYNRSYFIERLLKYYLLNNLNQDIIIADASDQETLTKNKKLYKTLASKLNLSVKFLHGLSVIECLDQLLDEINTPYVVLNPDDDFLIPSSLNKMSKFLDENPNYSGVNAKSVAIKEEFNGKKNKIITTSRYLMKELKADTPIKRVDQLFSNYFGVLFSLFRQDVFKESYLNIPGNSIISNELIPAFRAASMGNIEHLNFLYLVRSVHSNRVFISEFYEAILESSWSENIKLFKEDFNRMIFSNKDEIGSELSFEKIMIKYYAREKKHPANSFFHKIKAILYVVVNFSEIYLIKGIKNPFYTGSKELKYLVNFVESNNKESMK